MTAPLLLQVWLADAMVHGIDRETLPSSLRMGVDLDQLIVKVGAQSIEVRLTLEFFLFTEDPSKPVLEVGSEWRLLYARNGLEGRKAMKALARDVALDHVWGPWRMWLNATMAAVGLQPPNVPWACPDAVREQADDWTEDEGFVQRVDG